MIRRKHKNALCGKNAVSSSSSSLGAATLCEKGVFEGRNHTFSRLHTTLYGYLDPYTKGPSLTVSCDQLIQYRLHRTCFWGALRVVYFMSHSPLKTNKSITNFRWHVAANRDQIVSPVTACAIDHPTNSKPSWSCYV